MGKTLTLSEQPVGHVTLPSGRTLAIRGLDRKGHRLVREIQAGASDMSIIWELARRLVPDVSDDELDGLTVHQVGQIATIACTATPAQPGAFSIPAGGIA